MHRVWSTQEGDMLLTWGHLSLDTGWSSRMDFLVSERGVIKLRIIAGSETFRKLMIAKDRDVVAKLHIGCKGINLASDSKYYKVSEANWVFSSEMPEVEFVFKEAKATSFYD